MASEPRIGSAEPAGQSRRLEQSDLADRVVLRTGDDVVLVARWQPSAEARATVVLVHGFADRGDGPAMQGLAEALVSSGCNVLTYDARGHGDSGGQCGVGSTEHADVQAAVEFAVHGAPPVVVVGVSMGACATVRYLASDLGGLVAGAVLVSGPARWRMRLSPVGLATAALTRTRPGRSFAARRLGVQVAPRWQVGESPERSMARITVPVAVVHGTLDRLLHVSHARRLVDAAAGPAKEIVVTGMGHGVQDAYGAELVEAVGWVLNEAALAGSRPPLPTTTPAR